MVLAMVMHMNIYRNGSGGDSVASSMDMFEIISAATQTPFQSPLVLPPKGDNLGLTLPYGGGKPTMLATTTAAIEIISKLYHNKIICKILQNLQKTQGQLNNKTSNMARSFTQLSKIADTLIKDKLIILVYINMQDNLFMTQIIGHMI